VLCADIPLILRRDIYATAALAGGGVFVLLQGMGLSELVAGLIASGVIIALRIAAIFWGLRLPTFRLRDDSS
jgi:uncharacterized membrane protein YeiH